MKLFAKSLMAATLMAVTLTGCAPSLSPDAYTTSGVGQVNRVVPGTVVSTRPVKISGDSNLAGTLIGGAAGAVAGSTIGNGGGSVLAAVGGGLAGALIGNQVQKGLSSQTGLEYIIKDRHGNMFSVVQGNNPVYRPGTHVLVEYGTRARVIPDPAYQ
jgi:outer membrane lipoprotein SlyB